MNRAIYNTYISGTEGKKFKENETLIGGFFLTLQIHFRYIHKMFTLETRDGQMHIFFIYVIMLDNGFHQYLAFNVTAIWLKKFKVDKDYHHN